MRNFERGGSFRKREGPGRPRDRDSGDSGGGFRSRGSFDNRRKGGAFELHTARCDKCGEMCEVPFKPTNNKPVYCRDCFTQRNESPNFEKFDRFESGSRRNDSARSAAAAAPDNTTKKAIAQINKKLDKILTLLGGEVDSSEEEDSEGEE